MQSKKLPQSVSGLVPRTGKMNSCRWTAPRFRPHTRAHKLIPAEKTSQCQEMRSSSCLSDWLSLHPNCTFNKWLSLSVSIWAASQRDNSSVCAWGDYSIPRPSHPPSIHTQIQGYWHSGTVKSHKRTKTTQHGCTQGAWESFWPLAREKRELHPLGGKNELFPESAWKRFQNTLSLNNNEYTHINLLLVSELVWRNLHTVCKFNFWTNICNSGLGDVFDFFLQKASQLCRHAVRSPCCPASSWLPSPGTWVNGRKGKWNTGRRGVASRGSCAGSAWFSAPLAGSFQTACRCSPPPAGSCKTDQQGLHTILADRIIIRV